MYVYIYIHLYLYLYQTTYCQSTYLSIYLFIYLSFHVCIHTIVVMFMRYPPTNHFTNKRFDTLNTGATYLPITWYLFLSLCVCVCVCRNSWICCRFNCTNGDQKILYCCQNTTVYMVSLTTNPYLFFSSAFPHFLCIYPYLYQYLYICNVN